MRHFLLATAFSALALTGCTFTVVGNAPKTEDAVEHNKTINATFAKSEQFLDACDESDQDLAAIRFHTNVLYLSASIITLGLYVPQNVTWWCGSEEPECQDGDTSEECEVYVPGDR